MDLRHFRYFQAVAEELNFSKAGRRLRVAQPALSRAVRELEEELGVSLLSRNRRGVSMTEAGLVLLGEIGLLLQRVDDAVRRVRRTAAGEEGELRVGFIGAPTQAFLGSLLREYRRRYPRVNVVLEERTPERVWEMVAKGRLAVGLTRPVLASPGERLHTMLLRKEALCAVLPEGHALGKLKALNWLQLADQPLIFLARREGVGLHDATIAACQAAKFTPQIAHTPSVISTVLSYVEAGAGVGIIPESVTALAGHARLMFRPLRPAHTVDLVMVWNEKETSPAAVAFRKLIAEWRKDRRLWQQS